MGKIIITAVEDLRAFLFVPSHEGEVVISPSIAVVLSNFYSFPSYGGKTVLFEHKIDRLISIRPLMRGERLPLIHPFAV